MCQKIKTTAIIAVMAILVVSTANAQKPKIAVLDFKAGANVEQSEVTGVSAMLITALNETGKFMIVERTQVNSVINEQGLQLSYLTQKQMVKIGEILNVSYIVVGDVNSNFGQYNVDTRILDVETAEMQSGAGETWQKGTSYRGTMEKLAQKLSAKINTPTASHSTPQNTVTFNNAVTLYGYLHVYPKDLGHFTVKPTSLIENINKSNSYGYNDWRLPTQEELEILKNNSNDIGLQQTLNYMNNENNNGYVRLVTTGKLASIKQAEEAEQRRIAEQRATEQRRLEEERRNSKSVVINGITWATCNIGSRGTFVNSSEDFGRAYSQSDAQNACPSGWRLPTEAEFRRLINAGCQYTSVNGVYGYLFGSGINALFLPLAQCH